LNHKNFLKYSVLLSSGIFFSSCFGLRVEAKISAVGKVEALLQYTISVAALELGLSESNALYIPLTIDKNVFSQRVLANSGELLSWSVRSGTDSYLVDARVAFPDLPSFISFLDTGKKLIQYTSGENTNRLTVTIPEANTGTDPDFLKFLETVFPDDSIEISLELPKLPKSSKGFKVERNKAVFSDASTKIYILKTGINLELSW